MGLYRVTWGDEAEIVTADCEADAWAAFVDGNDTARRHPKLFERTIAVVESVDDASVEDDAESPVADEAARDAIDRIGRMRSVEKLQEIINADGRETVIEAARQRLAEIGEN